MPFLTENDINALQRALEIRFSCHETGVNDKQLLFQFEESQALLKFAETFSINVSQSALTTLECIVDTIFDTTPVQKLREATQGQRRFDEACQEKHIRQIFFRKIPHQNDFLLQIQFESNTDLQTFNAFLKNSNDSIQKFQYDNQLIRLSVLESTIAKTLWEQYFYPGFFEYLKKNSDKFGAYPYTSETQEKNAVAKCALQ